MTNLSLSETYKKHCRWFHDMLGSEGLLTRTESDAHMGGLIEENLRHSPVTAICGGTSEISRNMIAEIHLGPRTRWPYRSGETPDH